MIYLPIGSVFLLVGLLLFYLQHRKNVRIKQIVENGYYVMAKVDHIIANVIAHITFGAQSRNQAVFLIREINKKFIEKRLVRHGQYVNAVVKSIAIDPGVEYGRAESSISFGVKA